MYNTSVSVYLKTKYTNTLHALLSSGTLISLEYKFFKTFKFCPLLRLYSNKRNAVDLAFV